MPRSGGIAQSVLFLARGLRSCGIGRTLSGRGRSRRQRPAVPLPRHGCADRDAARSAKTILRLSARYSNRCPSSTSRYAHSEYQTTLSLRLKAELNRIAPAGTPRHFVVNTGAEAVENAIKSVLLNRVKTSDEGDGGFIVSFEGAFHGRTLGSLAVTQRRKARLGFPTFDWPHIAFPFEEEGAPKATARREERSLKQLWDLLVSGRLPRAEKPIDTYRREMDALDEFLARPDQDLKAFVDGAAREPRARCRPSIASRRGRARRADSGRRWRAPGKRAIHAQAAAADEDLRRAAHLR